MKQAMSVSICVPSPMSFRRILARGSRNHMPHYEQVVLRFNPKDADAFDLVIVEAAH